jgi:hypothetical protein
MPPPQNGGILTIAKKLKNNGTANRKLRTKIRSSRWKDSTKKSFEQNLAACDCFNYGSFFIVEYCFDVELRKKFGSKQIGVD